VIQFYRVWSFFRACETLVEHNSPGGCAPGTVDGLYSLSESLQWSKGANMYVRQLYDERAKAERLLKRLYEKDSKMRKKGG